MKKNAVIIICVIAVLAMALSAVYFIPKTFGKNVEPSEVAKINVFDGGTGVGFTVDNPEDIRYIVENIKGKTMKKNGLSIGKMGYGFRVEYIGNDGKAVIPEFIINSESDMRKDPFFYSCDGGLCFDYLMDLEGKNEGA